MKICITGDPTNKPKFSSSIIVSNLNSALKELNLYNETDSIRVHYDCVCNSHGEFDKIDIFLCTYEICLNDMIVNNAGGKPILGVSRHNFQNILDSGYPKEKVGWFPLGVDSEKFKPSPKIDSSLGELVFTTASESLSRGGYDVLIDSFGTCFAGGPEILVLKDRNGLKRFEEYVSERASYYNIKIKYINDNWTSKQMLDLYSKSDILVYLNFCSTYSLPVAEYASAAKTIVCNAYSGPADYLTSDYNAVTPDFDIKYVDEDLSRLLSIGTRNFFFNGNYAKRPQWSIPKKDSVSEALIRVKNDKQLCQKLATNARISAVGMSWQKSVLALVESLKKLGFS